VCFSARIGDRRAKTPVPAPGSRILSRIGRVGTWRTGDSGHRLLGCGGWNTPFAVWDIHPRPNLGGRVGRTANSRIRHSFLASTSWRKDLPGETSHPRRCTMFKTSKFVPSPRLPIPTRLLLGVLAVGLPLTFSQGSRFIQPAEVGVAEAASPSTLEAPAPTECGYCWPSGRSKHYSHAAWAPMSGAGYGDGWHTRDEPGNCSLVHGICVFVAAADEGQLNAVELTDAITEAVASRDVGRLARLAMAPPVQLFAARSAIQILGCDEMTVVGHVPVDQALLAAVDAAAAQLFVAPQ